MERVQSVGGWEAVRLGCAALVSNYPDGLEWTPPISNAMVYPNPQTEPNSYYITNLDFGTLPPAIAAMKPKVVQFYPRKVLQQFSGNEGEKWFGTNLVVRIDIFGLHRTGGHDQPWLGLDVLCESGVTSYSPHRLRSIVPLKYWKYRKITDDIYEFY